MPESLNAAFDPSHEAIIQRFEDAWQRAGHPDLADFLPPDLTQPRKLLLKLIHVDIERRLQAGEAVRVESYLSRFPELAGDTEVLLELLSSEFEQRRHREPDLSLVEYERRFPARRERLVAQLLRGADINLPQRTPPPPPNPSSTVLVTGDTTARYRSERLHARGGLGEVHLATDTLLGRAVALKRLRPDRAADAESLARFRTEAEITGRLEHPGIVPIHDFRLDETGQPNYVMRFVEGRTLADAIRELHETGHGRLPLGLPLRQLLQHFVAACNAVAYAHSRGVLHRDLKPANIMLGQFGETLVVDWGLAKVIGVRDPVRVQGTETLPRPSSQPERSTQQGDALGTPAYMSPEQAKGLWEIVGPASDVFSLGATLYQLLTNHPPYEGGNAQHVLLLAIQGKCPPAGAVRPGVPRALEAICARAMTPDPEQRYATATALADDIEHWLADEPVSAFGEPLPVRARRWARKHPGVVAGIAATVLVGVVALAVSSILLGKTNSELKTSNTNLDQANSELKTEKAATAEALEQAQEERRIAQAGRDFFLNKLLGQSDLRTQSDALLRVGGVAEVAKAKRNPTIRDLLDRAAAELAPDKIEANFPKQPLVQAEILRTVGDTYRGLGELALAIEFLERSAGVRKEQLGPEHADTLSTLNNLALAYLAAGKLPEAIQLFEQVRAAQETKLGPEHRDTLTTLNNLALAYKAAGKLPEAIQLFEQVRATAEANLGPEHPNTLTTLDNLALAYLAAGKLPEATQLLEQVRAARETNLGPEHPNTLTTLNNLALAYLAAGKLPEAIQLFEQVRAAQETKLGPEHPDTLTTLNNLAGAYHTAGKLPVAIKLYKQVQASEETKLGPEHPDTLTTLHNLAGAYEAAGKLPDAIKLYEQVRAAAETKLGPEHPRFLATLFNLALAYRAIGKVPQAIQLYEQVRAARETKLGPEHEDTLNTINNLAEAYQAAGNLKQALPLFERVAAVIEKRQFLHEHAGRIVDALADCYERLKQFEQAENWRRKWLAVARERAGPQTPGYAGELAGLGLNLLQQEKWSDAEAVLRECLAIRAKTQPDEWTTFNTKSMLGEALAGQKQYTDAEPLLVSGYEGMKVREDKIPAQGKVRLTEAIDRLVRLYEATGKQDEAAKWRKELAAQQGQESKPTVR